MNLGNIYDLVLLQLGKDVYGGYLTPLNFNEIAPKVNIDKLNQLLKEYEVDREVSRNLESLFKTMGDPSNTPMTFDTYGYSEIPSDYYYFSRAEYLDNVNTCDGVVVKNRMVEMLDQAEFNARIITTLKYPTTRQPIMTTQNTKFRIVPRVDSVRFTYVRQPDAPYYDYDIVNGVPVYLPPNTVHTNSSVLPVGTPSQSVEFEYPEAVYPDLINLISLAYSIKIRDEFGVQTTTITQ